MLRLIAFALAVVVGGCEDPETVAPPVQAPERATIEADSDAYAMLMPRDLGTPSKAAIIDGEWIFDTPTAAGWAALPLPAPEIDGNKRDYRLKYFRLTIERGACADPRLRPTLPDGVAISSDHSELSGCGGPRQASAEVAGAHWQVLRIGAKRAPKDASPTIFTLSTNGGVGGTLACNDVGIATRWTDRRFVQPRKGGWIEGTAVGCHGPAVDFGQLFWAAMYRAVSWTRRGDRLMIRFADGSDAELRLVL